MKQQNKSLKAILLLVSFYQMGMLAFSVILQEIADAFSKEPYGKIQAVVTLPDLFIMFTSIPVGFMLLKYPKKRMLQLSCLLFFTVGIGGIFFHSSLLQISIWAVFLGTAIGILIPVVLAVIHEWFCGIELQKMLGRQNAAVAWGGIAVVVGTGIIAAKKWYYVYTVFIPAVLCLIGVSKWVPYSRPGVDSPAAGVNRMNLKRVTGYSVIVMIFFSIYNAIPANISAYLRQCGMESSFLSGIIISILFLGSAISGFFYEKLYKKCTPYITELGLMLLFTGLVCLCTAHRVEMIVLGVLLGGSSLSIVMASCTAKLYEREHPEAADLSVAVMMAASDGGGFLSFVYTYISKWITGSDSVNMIYRTLCGFLFFMQIIICFVKIWDWKRRKQW